ncbi:MAG: ribonuclease P protein component [Amphibacillus sp.]|uniref:Ribonuclease P protein component n=1 Tax=Amphibacillus xylanus (strain ATCC 51415 / DSM 6626 / JCM 7361 / LMG 17667 / NBRC 15112 / Ep01) TaxID=698758 RepID=K0J548_AMPXN|nr:ribonuclease P protein component [Amphibacillus xylanus]NMA89802.1 ribonuclease P protein component [Amphibacillus sp.]BAM48542.1 ribonuclease P protein component [Amphibacillus xylanus NBRC 15112]
MRKINRLKSNDEFQNVFKNGKSFANRQLVVYYLPKKDQINFRVGLSVSKKIGNAVVRNQVKRYLRQAILEMEDDIKRDVDIVIIARQPVKSMDFHQIKKSLTHVLLNSKLLK